MKIIGITGGVGGRKDAAILEYLNNKCGATICQADQAGKKLQKKGTHALRPLWSILRRISWMRRASRHRERLAEIVLSKKEELSVLNGIIHPAVKEEDPQEDSQRGAEEYGICSSWRQRF